MLGESKKGSKEKLDDGHQPQGTQDNGKECKKSKEQYKLHCGHW